MNIMKATLHSNFFLRSFTHTYKSDVREDQTNILYRNIFRISQYNLVIFFSIIWTQKSNMLKDSRCHDLYNFVDTRWHYCYILPPEHRHNLLRFFSESLGISFHPVGLPSSQENKYETSIVTKLVRDSEYTSQISVQEFFIPLLARTVSCTSMS